MNNEIKVLIRDCTELLNDEFFTLNDIIITRHELTLLIDYITNLQQENERLKNNILITPFTKNTRERDIYKLRIEKAVEYIENNEVCCLEYIGRNEITGNLEKQIQRDLVNRTDLLNILNGRGDE